MLMRMRMTMIEDESDGDALRPRGSGSLEIQWGLVSGGWKSWRVHRSCRLLYFSCDWNLQKAGWRVSGTGEMSIL